MPPGFLGENLQYEKGNPWEKGAKTASELP
jgi:hypothetical protein